MIFLAPPSLKSMALILSNRVDLQLEVCRILYKLSEQSYLDLANQAYPLCKVASIEIGQGFGMIGTSTGTDVMIWVVEPRCHTLCALTPSFCLAQMPEIAALSWIEKIHHKALDGLPRG